MKNMTPEEVHQAALNDPDAQPTSPEDWADAVVLYPEDHERVQSGQISMKDLIEQRKKEKKRKKKTSQVHIRIDEILKERADRRAESLGLDLSNWIRMLMVKDLGGM